MLEPLPLSLLNDYLYCPRRAALKVIEGLRSANFHTQQGTILHNHADLAGYEVKAGVKLLRALPVFSERLGLSGKCDIVEVHPGACPEYRPVEYKKGKRRVFENDDAQLCAQALCLEEMLGIQVERGAVFHAASQHRREVVFTPELKCSTTQSILALRDLDAAGCVPAAVFKPQCEQCSLFEVCLPAITSLPGRVHRAISELFKP